MRIVIDKDIPEIQLLQESWEKSKPTYKVVAVNECDRFVYAKDLKKIDEATDSALDMAWDKTFEDCSAQIVETKNGKDATIWSSDGKLVVSEGVFGDLVKGLGDKMKQALNGLSKAFKKVKDGIAKLGNEVLNGLRGADYINKNNDMTGVGYKAMTKQMTVDENDVKNLEEYWKVLCTGVKQVVDQTKQYQPVDVKNISGVIMNSDKDPIQLKVDVVTAEGGEPQSLLLTQNGDAKPEAGEGKGDGGAGGDGKTGGTTAIAGASPEKIAAAVDKNPTQAVKTIGQQVAQNTKDIADLEKQLAAESSTWNFNNEVYTSKAGLERLAIKRFFNEMNDPGVKEIKFVSESGQVRTYYTNSGSSAYAAFKKDFRESTAKCEKATDLVGYKVTFESENSRSHLNGYKFSDFGMDDDFDSTSKTIVIKESVTRVSPNGDNSKETSTTKKEEVVKESTDDVDARFSTTTVDAKTPSANPEPSGFTLEVGELNPEDEVKSLLASMNKYDAVKPTDIQDGSISDGVTTYPDAEVVQEAEGDEEGGGDDAGGGDDDAGGDADPFADGGDDAGGDADPFADDAGGDDAGGDAGGDDADPFAGGGDDAGGDAGAEGGDAGAGGGDATSSNAGEGDAASDPNSPEGEPAPESPVNTDAQGEPKSQYNINVTEPFNVNDDFSLNEEEQKEFFGKIDQLVKIPDMDNYSLYLYQITPENMNLDDVHYIQALYELSVKLGLLEDVYADSNLLEKYNSYKYSVVKDGENKEGEDFKVQEQNNPIWGNKVMLEEAKDNNSKKPRGISKVQDDNEDKNKWVKDNSKEDLENKKQDDRRGPKWTKLDKDQNGADKPIVIDAAKEAWDSVNGKKDGKAKEDADKKLLDGTSEGQFHGLGWLVTFKAMQFGSPRYLTLYIKRNGNDKAEKQCEDYLKRLSYTEIEFVNIDEVDPYEYVYRSCSGMKTPEQVRTEKYANEAVPVTYLESTDKKVNVGDFIYTPADTFGGNGWNTVLAQVVEVDGDKFTAKAVDSTGNKSWQLDVVGKTKEMRGNSSYGKTTEAEFRELKNRELARESAETKVPESIPGDIKRDIKRVITKLNAEIRGTKQFNFLKECGVEKPQIDHLQFLAGYKTAQVNETLSETTYKFIFRKDDSTFSRMFYSNLKEKLFKYLGSFAQKFNLECGCEVKPTMICIDFMRSDLGNPTYDLDTMIVEPDKTEVPTLDQAMEIAKTM